MKTLAHPHDLLAYIDTLLGQMADLVAGHDPQQSPFGEVLGPHLRHIIEHYEALTGQLPLAGQSAPVVVDYDSRARDLRVQTDPAFALVRIGLLRATVQSLHRWPQSDFDEAVEVHTQGGAQGEFWFAAPSSWLRELGFVASHTVHHFAVVKAHAAQQGRSLGDRFGKAPATVAYESAANRAELAA